jgi:hypothetical protein
MAAAGSSQGEGCPIPRSIIPAGISFWEEENVVIAWNRLLQCNLPKKVQYS